jgi:hypothetical protein
LWGNDLTINHWQGIWFNLADKWFQGWMSGRSGKQDSKRKGDYAHQETQEGAQERELP